MLTVHLTTSDEKKTHSDVASFRCATPVGPIKILPRHAPLITALKPGKAYLTKSTGVISHDIASGGLLKVEKDVLTVVS